MESLEDYLKQKRAEDDAEWYARADAEFWSNKLDALYISLRNGWPFAWPADPPADWVAGALKMAKDYPARYIEIATAAKRAAERRAETAGGAQ